VEEKAQRAWFKRSVPSFIGLEIAAVGDMSCRSQPIRQQATAAGKEEKKQSEQVK
jgi:hypothetical protein